MEEALFISKHSSVFTIKENVNVLFRPVVMSDKSRLIFCINFISINK